MPVFRRNHWGNGLTCEENPGGFPGAKESMEAETMVLTTKGTTGTSTIKEKQRFGRLIDYISCWCVCALLRNFQVSTLEDKVDTLGLRQDMATRRIYHPKWI